VIDFYKSDDEEDDEDEHDYGNRDQSLPTRTKLFEDYNNHNDEGDDDAIVVSSWIDNYHYLLVEQEKRQKKIQFFVDDDQDDNDNNNNNIHSSDEEEESSSCGSCCSLDTTSTWQSMDTNEAEKFRDFLDECIANQGIHGKNTKNSILARMIREVLVGPCDDDFEIDGDFDSDCDYSNDNDNDNEGDENNHDNESDNDNDNDDNNNNSNSNSNNNIGEQEKNDDCDCDSECDDDYTNDDNSCKPSLDHRIILLGCMNEGHRKQPQTPIFDGKCDKSNSSSINSNNSSDQFPEDLLFMVALDSE